MPKQSKKAAANGKSSAQAVRMTTGQAVVTLCGKDFYLGPYGSSESDEEYDRLIRGWIAHGRKLPEI